MTDTRSSIQMVYQYSDGKTIVGIAGNWRIYVNKGYIPAYAWIENLDGSNRTHAPENLAQNKLAMWCIEEVSRQENIPTLEDIRKKSPNVLRERVTEWLSKYSSINAQIFISRVMWEWTHEHYKYNKEVSGYKDLIEIRDILYEPNHTFFHILCQEDLEPYTPKKQFTGNNKDIAIEEIEVDAKEWSMELSRLPFYETLYTFTLGVGDYLRNYDVSNKNGEEPKTSQGNFLWDLSKLLSVF